MTTLGSRIRQVLAEMGMSQSELARKVGVKQQTINYLCDPHNAGETSRHAVKIAEVLGVSPAWLQTGTGSPRDVVVPTSAIGRRLKQLPLVDFRLLPKWLKERDHAYVIQTVMTDIDATDDAFCLEIAGDAMNPAFIEGDWIIVDPAVLPVPGDFVLARVDGAILFRKFRQTGIEEGGAVQYELVPNNNDYPSIQSSRSQVEILGTMVEHRRFRKRRH